MATSLVANDTNSTKNTWTKAKKEEWIKKILKRKQKAKTLEKQNKALKKIRQALEQAKK